MSNIGANPANYVGTLAITGNVTTTGDQTYTANNIVLGDGQSNQVQNFTSTGGGRVSFNTGAHGGTSAPTSYIANFDLHGGALIGMSGSSVNYEIAGPSPASNPRGFDWGAFEASVAGRQAAATAMYGQLETSLTASVTVGDLSVPSSQNVDCCDNENEAIEPDEGLLSKRAKPAR